MSGIIYTLFVFAGWLLMLGYATKTKRFVWKEYWVMAVLPIAGLLGLIYLEGLIPLYVYLVGVVTGPIIEWFGGWLYYKINGSRLYGHTKN